VSNALSKKPKSVFVIAGEISGDELGGRLMASLKQKNPDITWHGVGGKTMEAQGLHSMFPMSDLAVIGVSAVIKRLPLLLRRIRETAQAVIMANPDILILIDAPDFTHRVAKKVRKAAPHIRIINYVCPSVWAWRPWRAKAMRHYIDQVLCILPFEPDVLKELHGPRGTYVGHPLAQSLDLMTPSVSEAAIRETAPYKVLALPGSRRSEIERHLDVMGRILARMQDKTGPIEIIIPAVDHLYEEIEQRTKSWPIKPQLARGREAKYKAFREARAALAVSGTVTLELALSNVPSVVIYRVSKFDRMLKFLVRVSSIVLPSLMLGEKFFPEFVAHTLDEDAILHELEMALTDSQQRAQITQKSERLRALSVQGEPPTWALLTGLSK
jgi:lipid-A-disaccharide synthase